MYFRSLSLDEQLCRGWEYETLFLVSHLYVDVFRLFLDASGMELLFLFERRLCL
jgi:hypothetical protein